MSLFKLSQFTLRSLAHRQHKSQKIRCIGKREIFSSYKNINYNPQNTVKTNKAKYNSLNKQLPTSVEFCVLYVM